MTTFSTIFLKCPYCGILMTSYELMSYTVHNVESWSDGKVDAGIPEIKRIGICAACRREFWIDDAKYSPAPDWHPEQDIASVLDINDLEWFFDDDREIKSFDYYFKLLEDGFADNDEREFYLRTHLLWSANDMLRYQLPWWRARNPGMLTRILNRKRKVHKILGTLSNIYRENLGRLIFLYIKSGNVDLLYLAEMYREQGNFKKAAEILARIEKKGSIWTKCRRKVRMRDRKVFKV